MKTFPSDNGEEIQNSKNIICANRQIGMAETRDNGYVYDKLLKKKKKIRLIRLNQE